MFSQCFFDISNTQIQGEIDSGFIRKLDEIKDEALFANCTQFYVAIFVPRLSGSCLKLPITHTFNK